MYIDKNLWYICQITGKKIKDIHKEYGGVGGVYRTETFTKYLIKEHNLTPEEYFIKHCNIEQPVCPCGICNKKCKLNTGINSNFSWSKYACGRYKGTLEWAEKAKISRKGKGNPMYKKTPWNKGLTAKQDYRIKNMSELSKNRKVSKETKKRQSESAKKRKVHGHTGIKHSEESKQKMRKATLRKIQEGKFSQLKSKPHIELRKILIDLKVCFREEEVVKYWSFDFYLPKYNIYIEVDGDYFHSNPKRYPSGPKTKTQKINHARDLSKNKFCKNNKIKLYRFWEDDILNNKQEITCRLKELLRLNH